MAARTPKAVVLLSGGLDSATTLALARSNGFECYALSIAYGQRQHVELAAAERVARHLGCAMHRIASIDLRIFGGSALTSSELAVPKDRLRQPDPPHAHPPPPGEGLAGPEEAGEIPCTYVPARNTIFLAYALGWAEVLGARDIFLGVNAVDYSGYPDCRPQFVTAFERLANLATAAGDQCPHEPYFRIQAPLLRLSKAEIIRRGVELGVDYSMTHSCYDPQGELACGHCDACVLRRQGFLGAGVPDPTRYALAKTPTRPTRPTQPTRPTRPTREPIDMQQTIRSTTVLVVRRPGHVVIAADGQVTMGNTVVKHGAQKLRRMHNGEVLAGFAGATADAFTLFERFEAKLKDYSGNVTRAAVELTKDWRTDRMLRRLEALLLVADRERTFLLSGTGDVLEPDQGVIAVGSGGTIATAAARALLDHTELDASAIAKAAMELAAELCVYTNDHITYFELQEPKV